MRSPHKAHKDRRAPRKGAGGLCWVGRDSRFLLAQPGQKAAGHGQLFRVHGARPAPPLSHRRPRYKITGTDTIGPCRSRFLPLAGGLSGQAPLQAGLQDVQNLLLVQDVVTPLHDEGALDDAGEHVLGDSQLGQSKGQAQFLHPGFHGV